MKIGDIFESAEGIIPQEVLDLCADGKAYIDEVKPITKIVEEEFLLSPAEYDEDGNLISAERYGTKQVEKTIRRFQIVAVPEPTAEELQEQALASAKVERAEAVSKIVVDVDGMIFDGDEDSQTRMSRTITASQALGLPEDTTISWAMADTNPKKVEQVTVKQLAQALYLAGCKQSELWCKPYGVTGTTQTGLEYLNSLGK